MYQFAYLFGIGIALIFWLTFFLARRGLRKEQIFISLLSTPLGPISQIFWFSESYWRPEYLFSIKILGVGVGVEEALFGFAAGGISSVIYEIIFRKEVSYGKRRTALAIVIFGGGALFFVLLAVGGLNPIWASNVALFTAAVTMVFLDRTLKFDFLFSGILMLFVAIVIYLFSLSLYPNLVEQFFIPHGISGITMLGIPLEELVWFTTWGAFAGIFYEFWRNAEGYSTHVLKVKQTFDI